MTDTPPPLRLLHRTSPPGALGLPRLVEAATAILIAALAWTSGPLMAGERSGSLQVGARVLPRHPAAAHALADLPVPGGSQRMTSHPFGGSFRYDGALAATIDFYRKEMPRRGFNLLRASGDGSRLVWDDATTRIELELRSTLGAVPQTRIVIRASRSESSSRAPGA